LRGLSPSDLSSCGPGSCGPGPSGPGSSDLGPSGPGSFRPRPIASYHTGILSCYGLCWEGLQPSQGAGDAPPAPEGSA